MKIRKLALLGAACALLAAFPAGGMATEPRGTSGPPGFTENARDALAFLSGDGYLMEGFSSHLPVLVLYQDGGFTLHSEEEALSPAFLAAGGAHGKASAQSPGEAAPLQPPREKKDYLLDISAPSLHASLWEGEAVLSQWSLLGGMYDKSLLRNYLALSLAREMDNAAPLARHCEVFAEDGMGYRYEGVYLLVATPDTGAFRFQRGNGGDANAVPLDTHALRQGLLADGLYVPSSPALDGAQLSFLAETIDTAEKSVFSSDYDAFSRYDKHLDSDRLYNYFILYELFGNARGAQRAHYAYQPRSDTFAPVAAADFEFSADNGQEEALDFASLDMRSTPYYAALIRSTNFVRGLQRRYHALHQESLNGASLDSRIDQAVLLLGDAQARDWARWQPLYAGEEMYRLLPAPSPDEDDAAPVLDRNTYAYDQEINKLKFTLRGHGRRMFAGIASLYNQKDMVGDDASYVKNTWMLLVFLLVFIAAVRIVRIRTR